MKRIEIEGQKFGKLFVVRRVKDRFYGEHSEIWYHVKCECGKEFETRGYMIRTGRIQACSVCKPKGFRHGFCGTKEYQIWNSVKSRADEQGIKFTLKPCDISVPKRCPLLDIRISASNSKTSFNSPSVDRKDHKKGYTKENTWVISQKANTIKSNASLPELQLLVKNLEKYIGVPLSQ